MRAGVVRGLAQRSPPPPSLPHIHSQTHWWTFLSSLPRGSSLDGQKSMDSAVRRTWVRASLSFTYWLHCWEESTFPGLSGLSCKMGTPTILASRRHGDGQVGG